MSNLYFDNMAATPLDPEVLSAMLPFWTSPLLCANHAGDHQSSATVRQHVELARQTILESIGGHELDHITFTSGATESINLAIQGACSAYGEQKKHLVTFNTEHAATLACFEAMKPQGFDITVLPVLPTGHIDLVQFEKALTQETLLVSCMHVNNETGIIHDIECISKIVHKKGILLHLDCAQSMGKIRDPLRGLSIDYASLSAHKCHGPQGIGMLYRSHKSKRRLCKQLHGSSHFNSYRPGTLPTALIIGMAKAFALAHQYFPSRYEYVLQLFTKIRNHLPSDIIWHGALQHRVPHNINISLPHYVSQEQCQLLRDRFSLSRASSCNQSGLSHVLSAMNITEDAQLRTVRAGITHMSTHEDVDLLIKALRVFQR